MSGVVFLDFDIIELTFNRDGVYHVIPVVSSPIDVIGEISPPMKFDSNDWWKWALALVGIILLLILLAPVLPYIIQGAIFIVFLPFKLIITLCKTMHAKCIERKKRKNK